MQIVLLIALTAILVVGQVECGQDEEDDGKLVDSAGFRIRITVNSWVL